MDRLFSMTPLLDVVCLLLFFFLTTYNDLQEVHASLSAGGGSVVGGASLQIEVLGTSYRVNGQSVDGTRLRGLVAEYAFFDPDLAVRVRPTADVSHGNVVRVLDACYEHGLRSVSVQVKD